jgi:hypothetical protein
METIAFTGDEWQFEQLNFDKKEWIDEGLKFVQYEKQLGEEEAAIQVCFAYKEGEVIETTCEIRIDHEYIKINTSKVYKLMQLYRIITGTKL